MQAMQKLIVDFLKERGWDVRATPANYAKSIAIEAAELLELFQWDEVTAKDLLKNKILLREVKNELADVLIYCFDLASLLKLDPEKIMREKMRQNRRKYPIKAVKGNSSNYYQIKKASRSKKK